MVREAADVDDDTVRSLGDPALIASRVTLLQQEIAAQRVACFEAQSAAHAGHAVYARRGNLFFKASDPGRVVKSQQESLQRLQARLDSFEKDAS
ncbi:Prefoldin subunit 1 [Plasmodiophora brassicae]|uniref:Prefoldin subunit 1 n=1 Tax=Plasmodiophora brassicae TaxID=37360 RepID=A0A0G4ITS7_PLABS|nr:hypothetical protein PBRA_006754 [Plasmodiophora brassicae]SPR00778.1 unnamed protein product [Plasmodiophora brassicae]